MNIYLTIILITVVICLTILLYRKFFGHTHSYKQISERDYTKTYNKGYSNERKLDETKILFMCEICGKTKTEYL